jgi:hypothetical protein
VQAVPCGARVQGSSCSARSFASRPWSAISVPSYLALGLVEGMGLPLDIVSAGSPRHDSPLLLLALAAWKVASPSSTEPSTVHFDRAYDNGPSRTRFRWSIRPYRTSRGLK